MKKRGIILFAIGMMLVTMAGCTKQENGVIKIASKPMTEQYILTEIMKQMIEAETDLTVEVTKGVGGGTTNIHPALVKGEFDLYPEYTGTAWVTVLKKTEIPEEDVLLKELQKEYEKEGLYFSDLYGFNNSYTLAVRKEIAEKFQLETYSDLAKASKEIVFGGNYDYMEREDGYPLLCSAYGMEFKDTVDMDIALKYKAMEQKEMDVTNAFTTDAMLSVADVKILEDDRHFFTTYYCGTVARKEVLEKYPSLKAVLDKMTGLISDEDMRNMNYEVEGKERDEAEVAKEFLTEKGIL